MAIDKKLTRFLLQRSTACTSPKWTRTFPSIRRLIFVSCEHSQRDSGENTCRRHRVSRL
jgi:hypothetical protein